MKKILRSILLIVSVIAALCFAACGSSKSADSSAAAASSAASVESSSVSSSDTQSESPELVTGNTAGSVTVVEDGEYSDKEHVALYIHEFGHLPSNYVTKNEAEAAGWVSSEGNLNTVLPGKSIGGDRYGNYEDMLPDGYSYTECDINYNPDNDTENPVYRGAERIIFNDEGMVFYTDDHYQTFTQLY